MIQQHVEGLSVETLTAAIGEPELSRWWQSYLGSLNTTLSDLPVTRHAEVAMSIPITTTSLQSEQSEAAAKDTRPRARLGGYRLTAHFDLVASNDDRAVIVDWKTEQRQPKREQLLQRAQTRVYRYVFTTAQQRPPGTVAMVYWFAQYPDRPTTLPYDAAQYAEDHRFLLDLIEEIEQRAKQDGEWDKTPHEHRCAYCVYRSLCNRGVSAGTHEPDEEDFDLVARINIEQIDAIEY